MLSVAAIAVVLLLMGVGVGWGAESPGEKIVKSHCVQCHRLDSKLESRFNLKAPDLMWAGSKYQRPWLIRWLTCKKTPLYAEGYRWDLTEAPSKHPMVTEAEANAIADYFAGHNKDQRVKVGAFDLSKVTGSKSRSAAWPTRRTPASAVIRSRRTERSSAGRRARSRT